MKHIRLLALLALLGCLIASCGGGLPTSSSALLPKTRFDPYPEEDQILGLTNAFRAQARTCGNQQFAAAPPLTRVEAVGDAAWIHSSEMSNADTEDHVGASTVDRLKARGFDPGINAEHRKKTALPPNPNDAFNVWAADPVACANLMNPNFTVLGAGMFGFYEGGTSAFWTLILTAPRGNAPAPSLTLNPTAATVKVGGAGIPFSATLTNSTDPITWSLTGPGTFGSAGAQAVYTPPTTGVGGSATLTAKAGALTASATITITPAGPPTLSISPTTATVTVGGAAIPFSATLTNSADPIVWSLTGPGTFGSAGAQAVYTPPSSGGAGTATLTATAGALTASATITVKAALTPTLTVNPATTTVTVGGTAVPFSATLANSTDPINWSLNGPGSISSNTGASTDYTPPANGAAGTATLTATAGALTASASITINAAPSLSITPSTATVTVGGAAITLNATLTNSTDAIAWSLTGPGSFSWAGTTFTYTPPASGGAGTATVTATAGALTANATITINAGAGSLTVSPATATATINGPDVALFANLNGSTDPITWTVTGPGDVYNKTGAFTWYMAPVSGAGGTVTVTAKAGALTASATITLNPAVQTFDQQFLALINQFRSQPQTCFNGNAVENMPAVPPVAYNAQLNTAAQLHSEDMANNNYFSHTGLNGSTFGQRIQAQGYPGTPQGENIAAGQDTAQGAFNSWRDSHAGHCQGMMNANANKIGLGYAINGNSSSKHLWTLVTGRQ